MSPQHVPATCPLVCAKLKGPLCPRHMHIKPVNYFVNFMFSSSLFCGYHRQEKASLLGFQNYAFLSLDSKMADSPSEVWKMITDLQSKSKGAAESELHALQVNKQQKQTTSHGFCSN